MTDSTCDYIIVDGVNELRVIDASDKARAATVVIAEKAAYTIPNEIPV